VGEDNQSDGQPVEPTLLKGHTNSARRQNRAEKIVSEAGQVMFKRGVGTRRAPHLLTCSKEEISVRQQTHEKEEIKVEYKTGGDRRLLRQRTVGIG